VIRKVVLTAVKRKDGRYAVRKNTGGYVNGEEKVKFLVEKGLIKAPAKKAAPAEEPAADAPAAE